MHAPHDALRLRQHLRLEVGLPPRRAFLQQGLHSGERGAREGGTAVSRTSRTAAPPRFCSRASINERSMGGSG